MRPIIGGRGNALCWALIERGWPIYVIIPVPLFRDYWRKSSIFSGHFAAITSGEGKVRDTEVDENSVQTVCMKFIFISQVFGVLGKKLL